MNKRIVPTIIILALIIGVKLIIAQCSGNTCPSYYTSAGPDRPAVPTAQDYAISPPKEQTSSEMNKYYDEKEMKITNQPTRMESGAPLPNKTLKPKKKKKTHKT